MRQVLSGEQPDHAVSAVVQARYPSLGSVCGHLQRIAGWEAPMRHHVHGVDLKELSWLEAQRRGLESMLDVRQSELSVTYDTGGAGRT